MWAIFFGVLTVVGFVVGILAWVDARRSLRVKLLAFEYTGSASLASASNPADATYKISILFERDGLTETIEGAHTTYLRFANFGREAIRRDDIAAASPLVVRIAFDEGGGRILSCNLDRVSRDVTQISLGPAVHRAENEATFAVDFDFLDQGDGGVVRLLSTRRPAELVLEGEVIGMPSGIQRTDLVNGGNRRVGLAYGAGAIADVLALALAVYVFVQVTGDWHDLWLLALPTVALCAPIMFVTTGLLMGTGRGRRRRFPSTLALPEWFEYRLSIDRHAYTKLAYPSGMDWSFEPDRIVDDSGNPKRISDHSLAPGTRPGPADHG